MSAKVTSHAAATKHGAVDKSAEVRTYLIIFACLAALTLMTVGVAYMNLPHAAGVVIALVIAALKVFLIASFFMHLRGEGTAHQLWRRRVLRAGADPDRVRPARPRSPSGRGGGASRVARARGQHAHYPPDAPAAPAAH